MATRAGTPPGPVFVQPSSTNAAFEGMEASFFAAASGDRPLSFAWYFNGQKLVSSGNQIQVLTGDTNTVLRLLNLTLAQSGAYTLVVTNAFGAVTSAPVQLSVALPVAPRIGAEPTSVQAEAGTDARITVALDGTEPIDLEWSFEGRPLEINILEGVIMERVANRVTLVLHSVTPARAGNYSLRARSPTGSATSRAIPLAVTVPPPPVLVTQPQSIAGEVGRNVELAAQATGAGTLRYAWFRTDRVGVTGSGEKLSIDLTPDTAAGYFVRVSNAGGAVTSEVANVVVRVPPPEFAPTQDVTVETGATAMIEFRLASFTEPAVEWLLNDVPMTHLTAWQITKSVQYVDNHSWHVFSLSSPRLTSLQSGRYSLRARNAGGSSEPRPITLDVLPPRRPVIGEMPAATNLNAGNPFELRATVAGTLPLSYEWRKDGVRIGASEPSFYESNPQPQSAGVYELIARNSSGAATSGPVQVTVEVLPPAIKGWQSEVAVGGGYFFNIGSEATVTGSPPFEFHWQHNGTNLPGHNLFPLHISSAEAHHGGIYVLQVRNSAGSATSSVTQVRVDVRPPTIASQPVGGTFPEGATAVLSPEVAGSDPLLYQWRLNGELLPGATSRTLALQNIRPSQAGAYSVEVRNSAGWVESGSARVDVTPDRRESGSIDVNFFSQVPLSVNALAIARDGRIILHTTDRAPVRLNEDGSLDPSFGMANSGLGGGFLALQPDGKVLAQNASHPARQSGLGRLNQDGTLDPTFRSDFCCGNRFAALSDGKVLLGGSFYLPESDSYHALLRLNADGSLDRPLLGNGSVSAITVLTDGKLLIEGVGRQPGSDSTVRLFRLNSDGSWDFSFQLPMVNGGVARLAVQEDGRILVATAVDGTASRRALVRLDPNGALDPSFNAGLPADQLVSALCPLRNGKVMVAIRPSSDSQTRLVRLRQDGSIDSGFPPVFADYDINAIAQKPDGAIVLGGYFTRLNNIARAGIAQFLPEETTPDSAPRIIEQPASRNVIAGRALELFVGAAGFPLPEYQWHFEGKPLEGETNFFLRFEDAQAADAGIYTVQVRNPFGTVVSGPASVALLAPPSTPGSVDDSYYPAKPSGGSILHSALHPDGGLVIAGNFTAVGGVERPGIARLLPNGDLDHSFRPNAYTNTSYGPLATQPDGRILAGLSRPNVAFQVVQLDASGAANPLFRVHLGSPIGERIHVQSDGKFFLAVEGGIARFNVDGTMDESFKAERNFEGITGFALQADGKILVAEHHSVTRLLAAGTVDETFVLRDKFPGSIASITAPSGGRIIIFGFGGAGWWHYPVAVVIDEHGAPTGWATPWRWFDTPPPVVSGLNGKTVVVENESAGAGVGTRIRRFHPDGTIDHCFDAGAGAFGTVQQLYMDASGDLVVVGDFLGMNGIARPGIARLHAGEPPSVAPSLNTRFAPQEVIAGTNLTLSLPAQCNFPPVTYQWQFSGLDIPGATNDTLTLENVRFAQGGAYQVVAKNSLGQTVGPPVLINVARESVNPGAVDLDFYPGEMNGHVSAVVVENDGALLIGGSFDRIAGVERIGLARLRPNGSLDKTFSPSLRANTRTVSRLPDGKLLLTGWFYDQPESELERLIPGGALDPSFALRSRFFGQIHARTLPNGQILVWNYSGKKDEAVPFGVALFSADGSLDVTFANSLRVVVISVQAQADGKLIVASRSPEEDRDETSVYRMQSDGTVDPSFRSQPIRGFTSMFLEKDGAVLITRELSDPEIPNFIRLLPDGAVDDTFQPGFPQYSLPWLHRAEGISQPFISYQPDAAKFRRVFDYLGKDGRPLNLLNTTFGEGLIDAVATLPDGRLVIGGSFSDVNGIPRRALALLHAPRSPVLLSSARRTLGGFQVGVQTTPGRKYALEHTASLDAPVWTAMPSIEGNGASMPLTDPSVPEKQRFYRVREE